MDTRAVDSTWEVLSSLIQTSDTAGVRALLETLEPFDVARAISRLSPEDRTRLLELLRPAEAADLVTELSHAQAADLIEQLPAGKAAAILDEIPSDHQADLLGLMPDREAILEEMSPQEASDARRLLDYPPDTAGGIMITEYLAFRGRQTVGEIVADLERNRGSYADYSFAMHIYGQDFSAVGGDAERGLKSFFDNFDEQSILERSMTSERARDLLIVPQLEELRTDSKIKEWKLDDRAVALLDDLIDDFRSGRFLP